MQQRLRAVASDEGAFDPFKGENKGYRKDNFYTGARDGAGNSDTKYLKIGGSVLGQIGALVSGKQIPAYKTEADFIRDAIIHRLHDVGEMIEDGSIFATINRVVKLDRIQQRQVELQEFAAIVANHEEVMSQCVQSEDTMLLRDLIEDAESDMEELRPNYQLKLQVIIDKFKSELEKLEAIEGR